MDIQILERVDSILSQMTLGEKVAQMMQIPYAQVGREEALRWARLGAGSFLHVLGEDAREIQRTACANRLGIPVLFGIDAVRGHALNDHATVFPTQLACACAWNPDAMRRMGRIVAQEVAADGLHWTFSPLLCLARDPRWGRTGETFGEDPYLTGSLPPRSFRGIRRKNATTASAFWPAPSITSPMVKQSAHGMPATRRSRGARRERCFFRPSRGQLMQVARRS